nr:glycosyltransferase family 4 protein [Lysobacter chinensis]
MTELAKGEKSPIEAFMDAAIEGGGRTEDLPWVLTYAPAAAMNPFQRILYSQASRHGFAVVPMTSLSQLGAVNWRGRSVIHLHWLALVLKGAVSKSDAAARLREFEVQLAMLKASGHRLVWSLHNILPHDCADRDAEVRLREILSERVDLIHVLSRSSVEEARPVFGIDESKVFYVPHPSYEDWYANLGDRAGGRLDLDIHPDAYMFLQFGSIQPYKGTVELVRAFNQLCELERGRRLQLTIAGKPVDWEYTRAVQDAAASNPAIRVIPNPMEEREIQTLFNAADVAVAPYTRTLNSGVALLAASFDKPLIAPAIGGVLETYRESDSLLYDPASDSGLLDAMALALRHPVESSSIAAIRERHAPAKISGEFFAQLNKRLGTGQ